MELHLSELKSSQRIKCTSMLNPALTHKKAIPSSLFRATSEIAERIRRRQSCGDDVSFLVRLGAAHSAAVAATSRAIALPTDDDDKDETRAFAITQRVLLERLEPGGSHTLSHPNDSTESPEHLFILAIKVDARQSQLTKLSRPIIDSHQNYTSQFNLLNH